MMACWKEIGLLGNEIRMVAPLLVRSTPVNLALTPAANVWARAILSDAGVTPDQVTWVRGGMDKPGLVGLDESKGAVPL